MKLLRFYSEAGGAVSLAKANASAYCTNFFPAPHKLQDWIDHGEIFCKTGVGSALFFRKDRDFWHLYFCAATPASLQRALAELPMIWTEPMVIDLVGREAELGDLVGLLEGCGFRRYQHLFRMARIVAPVAPGAAPPDTRVTVAGQADCQPVLDLLLGSFDRRAEQIPMPYEIEAAVEAGQILVVHHNGALAGLLFFETQGLTSTLRYWLIGPEFRAQRFGSGLMHRYFADNPAVKRFLLWVIAINTDAIGKYEHYGFSPDGLVDHVLANERICLCQRSLNY
jgi:hypothetical protein